MALAAYVAEDGLVEQGEGEGDRGILEVKLAMLLTFEMYIMRRSNKKKKKKYEDIVSFADKWMEL